MFFLAIVPDENIRRGFIYPGYILCKTHGKSKKRSQWRVTNVVNGQKCRFPKLLVRNPFEHPEMIEFLRYYRTREHAHKEKYIHEATKKYYPKGGLFWFECDKYGEQTGCTIFVMKVPSIPKGRRADGGSKALAEFLRHESNPLERIGTDYYLEDLELSDVKAVTIPCRNKRRKIRNRR